MELLTEQQEVQFTGLDKKDFEILALLQTNAKLTVREIAAKVHLSSTPTHERIKRMEQQGVILQYGALLDNRKVNKGIMVICHVSLKEHNKKAAGQFLSVVVDFKEVIECYNISGDFDFMLKIISTSMESFHKFFVNQLSEVPNIGQTKSIFVMDVIKQTHVLI
ncbi:Lrp/AsnC family transcriptional regulator [Mucilaginibacter flavus]|uniref:Lrp/AsnC family transcriptional regulator n=1 Tax=Mucilaginibacter flavus TaxID=931504 RepID=UPI0025B58F2D|nr:Lrp/AsnC family transcriptional regulator [Mucilaginibacter flavus]MDN3579860.1 Lrp/AsnC family transcriptional regulator [Mucilaginibacter flavus]